MKKFLDKSIEYLKGVGPKRADLLKKEKGIFTFGDMLRDFPFRYVDKTHITKIKYISSTDAPVLIKGRLSGIRSIGGRGRRRLHAFIEDGTGRLELVWFQGVDFLERSLIGGGEYLCYGKINYYQGSKNMTHPELELIEKEKGQNKGKLSPVYTSTEKLNAHRLGSKAQLRLRETLLDQFKPTYVKETLPDYLLKSLKLISLYEALVQIHIPRNKKELSEAKKRLKFDEFFFMQLRLWNRYKRRKSIISYPFEKVGDLFHSFYKNTLPFELTGAQKRVLKEIRNDLGSGYQMSRLLQGDVGSGKTIVALLTMLMAADNGYQSCIMAPTEILARQHFTGISTLLKDTDIEMALLTGSIKGKKRKEILQGLKSGELHIIVGTHALIEDPVRFSQLGLAIIDEQHRFGVNQRARLWTKAGEHPPHVLVMTATPIPRTLAMTVYGDLDVSTIDELPPGRKKIVTRQVRDRDRLKIFDFMKKQIEDGRQIYIVYPLIEESEKLDLADLNQGYEYLMTHFPRPTYQIGIVHGRMKAEDKDEEMQRFVEKKTQILVSTTVIEVGVDVPNATVMIIENAERFGLSQLHQLRGRVGRGGNQSYCLLMAGHKLSKQGRERLDVMCETNDGFKIAEADLRLRGPGDIEGLRQSGDIELHIANPLTDRPILESSRKIAQRILDDDPKLEKSMNARLKSYLDSVKKTMQWSLVG